MSRAWRSFLGPPHAPLLSRLLPVRRHGSQLTTTVVGRSNLIRSRGYASKSNGDCHTKIKRQDDATTKKHLYLVLDDHKDGFNIHKLDLADNNEVCESETRLLTEPPVFRVTLTTLGERAQFAAVGSCIVAIGTTVMSPMMYERWMPDDMGGVLIYDTKTPALTPHLPGGLRSTGYKAAIAVGNSLYMLGSEPPFRPWHNRGGSLHCLTTDPPVDHVRHVHKIVEEKFWGWQPLSDSSPWCWSNYGNPPMAPFLAKYITAHAVQASPTGAAAEHEIFVSVRPTERSVLGATYSFSRANFKWTWHGEWLPPVVGHAHYDGHLDAWVGLHAVDDRNTYEYPPRVTDGHLCAGNITSAPTWWNVGQEKLFHLDEDVAAGWRHIDAKLVPIASGEDCSEYCLVERLCPKGEDKKEKEEDDDHDDDEKEMEPEKPEETKEKKCLGDCSRYLLRLTCFRVQRGKHGEPMVTARLSARSYEVSSHSRYFDPQVFYM